MTTVDRANPDDGTGRDQDAVPTYRLAGVLALLGVEPADRPVDHPNSACTIRTQVKELS